MMPIKIALILSVLLQFGAAIIALSLVKRTINNIAWWLISFGFLLMAIRRVIEIFQVYNTPIKFITDLLGSWTGVLISIVMLISLIFIKRIFNIQKQIDDLRKQNESRVLSAILKTEEKERQHFSKELHDGLGPLLSAVKMAISTVGEDKSYNGQIISNADKLIDESISTLKEISNKLSPHVLKNFGLHKAVKSFINKLKITDNPHIHFNSNIENERFSFNIEVVLYRVVCELISNTLIHANAKNIYIDLLKDELYLSLKYIDDGEGFDEEIIKQEFIGLGYSNIRSRIKSLNGTFDIFTKPGEGVEVTSQIKLK
ncbi:MAG: sensor histidine kinase [Mariniphaga sp.]